MSGRISKFHNDFCKCQAEAQSFCSCRERGIPLKGTGMQCLAAAQRAVPDKSCSESPQVPCADTTKLLCLNKAGSNDLLQGQGRQGTTAGHGCPWSSLCFQQAELPSARYSSLPPPLPRMETTGELLNSSLFISLYNHLSVYDVDRGWK